MSKGEDTRRDIIGRAFSIASEVGLEGLTLGVLAERANLSKSGLFAHFKSKEALQLEVLERAIELFVENVVVPAVAKPRGEPRVKALFDRYLTWIRGSEVRDKMGGCFFMSLAHEYDDRPGPLRDRLVQSQREWHETVAKSARLAVKEGHFRADLDEAQFTFEVIGISMAFEQSFKLLADPSAEKKARAAFEALFARCRRSRK
ncbi:TetR/AcrR family transcriptional regulator [Pendulispora rubella]|uniref:TetR/AcrR family transcriptional regulator n=1 Tax=Pendulispora rubella TaxID=2741070 RepID=A0ABZ2L9M1_9BACT